MVRIFINSGHGGKDNGATGNGLKEKDLTLLIGKNIVKKLKAEYTGFKVKHFRNSDKYYSLKQITDKANKWKADIFVSIHINAGGGTGFESFVYNGGVKAKTIENQRIIHAEIMKEISKYNVVDRGKKKANFHVLRETTMPALLTENLFIDTLADSKLLKNRKYIASTVKGHVDGVVRVTGIKKKKKASKGTFYRVVTGSFKNKQNAEERQKELKKKGFDSFIDVFEK